MILSGKSVTHSCARRLISLASRGEPQWSLNESQRALIEASPSCNRHRAALRQLFCSSLQVSRQEPAIVSHQQAVFFLLPQCCLPAHAGKRPARRLCFCSFQVMHSRSAIAGLSANSSLIKFAATIFAFQIPLVWASTYVLVRSIRIRTRSRSCS